MDIEYRVTAIPPAPPEQGKGHQKRVRIAEFEEADWQYAEQMAAFLTRRGYSSVRVEEVRCCPPPCPLADKEEQGGT